METAQSGLEPRHRGATPSHLAALGHHVTTSALVLSALADTITFLVMGTAREANPIVAAWPIWSMLAKWVLVALLLAWRSRYAPPIRAFGAAAWTVGALTNLAAMGVI